AAGSDLRSAGSVHDFLFGKGIVWSSSGSRERAVDDAFARTDLFLPTSTNVFTADSVGYFYYVHIGAGGQTLTEQVVVLRLCAYFDPWSLHALRIRFLICRAGCVCMACLAA